MWQGKDYWRDALGDLLATYSSIYAYCSSWTKRSRGTVDPTDSTVDHFVPKSVAPAQAYEWANFRLCRRRLNTRKDSHQDVLDPFILAPGWFELDFQTFLLVPNSILPPADRERVVATIDRLELNDDDDYVYERIGAIRQYCLGDATYTQLVAQYPFIASEMRRQNFDRNFLSRMKAMFARYP
jgi:hypothetical protein